MSITLELVAREAVQVFGGLGHTRGGVGERVERIRRDVKGVAIPGVSQASPSSARLFYSLLTVSRSRKQGSEEIMLDYGVRSEVKLALGLGAKM